MARRRSDGLASLHQAWVKLARAGARAGVKALQHGLGPARRTAAKAAVAPARRAPADATGGAVIESIAVGIAGVRRYRCFVPNGAALEPRPLLVMLHGCRQDAAAFAVATRMDRLAARHGLCVLYPEQDPIAHPQACWNWYDTRSGRAQAEAALLMTAIDQVIARHGVDAGRVAIAGLSAGAAMAALMALRHPWRFAAVALHSGVAPGLADSAATALRAMRGQRSSAAAAAAAEAAATAAAGAAASPSAALPPLLVIHGRRDTVVDPRNARIAVEAWGHAASAAAGSERRLQRGRRYAMTVTEWRHRGRLAATLCEVDGLAHDWSGGAAGATHSDPAGPDASRLICTFVTRCFAAGRAAAPTTPGLAPT